MQDWQKLIQKYLADELSVDEKNALEKALLNDKDRMAEFAEDLLMHSDLYAAKAKLRDLSAGKLGQSVQATPATAGLTARTNDKDNLSSKANSDLSTTNVIAGSPNYRSWKPYLLAASIAFVALCGLQLTNVSSPNGGHQDLAGNVTSQQDDVPEPVSPAERPEPSVAAYLGRMQDCVWETTNFTEGTQLAINTKMNLRQGVAELIFDSGARVTIQGPCSLVVDDPEAFTLLVGNVSVQAAFGFKVSTPSGIAIDLGTEFGVSVDQQGGAEVHVFEGEVAFQARDNSGNFRDKSVVLTADQACRCSLGGIALHEFEANEAKFSWRTPRLLDESQVPPLRVRDDLKLWLAADRFVETDESGRVERWRDLVISENPSAEDALQLATEYRPELVERGINGRPSIRFGNGGTFLVTPPLTTTDEQTVFVVCSLGESDPNFQQIINYNGPPQRVVGSLGGYVSPAVFEICLRDRGDEDGLFAVCGEVFYGWDDGRNSIIKNVVEELNSIAVDEPVIICFQYSLQQQKMSLHLNGKLIMTQVAEVPIAITSRKILGNHPIMTTGSGIFHGDLGEVLIYNRALTDSEMQQVSTYLAERFGVGDE